MNVPREDKLTMKLRRIICNYDLSLHAQECANVFLSITRKLNKANFIGLNFLIGTVNALARQYMLESPKSNLPQIQTILNLCKNSGTWFAGAIPVSWVGTGVEVEFVYNQDLNYLATIIYTPKIKSDSNDPPKTIQVAYKGKKEVFSYICSLNYDNQHIYVQDNESNQLCIMTILKFIFSEIKLYLIEFAEPDFKQGYKDKFIKSLSKPLNHANEFINVLQKLFPAGSNQLISISKLSDRWEKPVNIVWDDKQVRNDDDNYKLPTIIYNSTTGQLYFLVWYSDVDKKGFMRHSAIKATDSLSSQLAFHQKMLIYCEDPIRHKKYIDMIKNAMNANHLMPSNRYFVDMSNDRGRSDNEITVQSYEVWINYLISENIPRINEYYNTDVSKDKSIIRNVFEESIISNTGNNKHASLFQTTIHGYLVSQKIIPSLESLSDITGNNTTGRLDKIEVHARNVANVLLNATRLIQRGHDYIVGRKFLIGSILDLAAKHVDQVINSSSDVKNVEWQALHEICRELKFDFSRLKPREYGDYYAQYPNEQVYEEDVDDNENIVNTDNSSLSDNSKVLKICYYHDGKSFGSRKQNDIQIRKNPSLGYWSYQDKIEYIGQLDSNYSFFLRKNITKSKTLFMNEFLTKLFNKLGFLDHFSYMQQQYTTWEGDNRFNLNVSVGSWSELEKTLITTFEHWNLNASVQKFSSITDFTRNKVFYSATKVTVVFLIQKNTNSKAYVPTRIRNAQTQEYNFLAWYSDADETGFMRHSEINKGEVLSARFAEFAKMLVYCEK